MPRGRIAALLFLHIVCHGNSAFIAIKHNWENTHQLSRAREFSEHWFNVLHEDYQLSHVSVAEESVRWGIWSVSGQTIGMQQRSVAVVAVLIGCLLLLFMATMILVSIDKEVADGKQLRNAVLVSSINHFCMGYNAGIIAGALRHIKNDPGFSPLGSSSQGMLVGCLLAGATLGAASGKVSDVYGRRQTMLAVSIAFFLGPIIMCSSTSFWMLLMGRFVAGWGVGMTSGLINVYISEISPAGHRGKLGGWAPFCGTSGIIVAYMTSVMLTSLPDGAWRLQLGSAALPAIAFMLLQDSIQESPRWQIAQGQLAEAHADVLKLHPSITADEAQSWIDCIREEVLVEGHDVHSGGIWSLATHNSRSFFLGTAINTLQQLSGVNIVIYFGPMILQTAGFSAAPAMVATLFVSLAQLAATGAVIGWVDHVGRRPVAMLGTGGMVVGHGLLITSFVVQSRSESLQTSMVWLAVAGMFLFRTAFSLSLGPLPYIMTTELFPQQVRAVGVAWSWTCNWGSNFVISYSFPILLEVLTGLYGRMLAIACLFTVFALFSVAAWIFVLVSLPETTGVTLEAASSNEVLGCRSVGKSDAA